MAGWKIHENPRSIEVSSFQKSPLINRIFAMFDSWSVGAMGFASPSQPQVDACQLDAVLNGRQGLLMAAPAALDDG